MWLLPTTYNIQHSRKCNLPRSLCLWYILYVFVDDVQQMPICWTLFILNIILSCRIIVSGLHSFWNLSIFAILASYFQISVEVIWLIKFLLSCHAYECAKLALTYKIPRIIINTIQKIEQRFKKVKNTNTSHTLYHSISDNHIYKILNSELQGNYSNNKWYIYIYHFLFIN